MSGSIFVYNLYACQYYQYYHDSIKTLSDSVKFILSSLSHPFRGDSIDSVNESMLIV